MKTIMRMFLSAVLLASVSAYGQVRTEISLREPNNSAFGSSEYGAYGFNAHNYSIGFGIGSSKMYGDWAYSNPQPVYIGYFEKNFTPGMSLGWTVSRGDLSSRDPYSLYRSFNRFTSVDQHLTVELGSLLGVIYRDYYDYYLLRLVTGLYAGVGLGIINNDLPRIANFNEGAPGQIETGNPTMLTNSTALYVPFNIGYNLYIPKLGPLKGAVINFNYQYSMTMSDYIDGYKPPYYANKRNDVYTVASIGLRFYVFHQPDF